MFKSLMVLSTFIFVIFTSPVIAGCGCCSCDCWQSVDVSLGWRRDDLDWKTKHLDDDSSYGDSSCYVLGDADSHIHFKKIDSYTISGKAKWIGSAWYARLSAEYGLTDKGRARELFRIESPFLYCPIGVETSNPIKRRSEVYDFNGAVGYPLSFCCNRWFIVPLIGFSWHRQHLRVKEERSCCSHSSSSCRSHSPYDCYDFHSNWLDSFPTSDTMSSHDHYNDYYSSSCTCSSDFCSSSSSSFPVCSSNCFVCSPSSNPFSSCTEPEIARALGLFNKHRTNNFRFTWYGFYLGTDIAYTLDCCWTLFSEIEFHVLADRCHRKRKSLTGVDFVDDYHEKGWAYGFNTVVGTTYCICNCWYGTIAVDYRWWKGHSKNDDLRWNMVGVKLGLGYSF